MWGQYPGGSGLSHDVDKSRRKVSYAASASSVTSVGAEIFGLGIGRYYVDDVDSTQL